MKTSSCKAKGRRLQQLVAQKISEAIGLPCGKDQPIESRPMSGGGVDIRLDREALKLFPYSVECFAEGTLVLTSEGFVPIEQITIGTKVFTSYGTFRRVTNTFVSISPTILKLKIKGISTPILVTPTHNFEKPLTRDFEVIKNLEYVSRSLYTDNRVDKKLNYFNLTKYLRKSPTNHSYCSCGCGRKLPSSKTARGSLKKFIKGHSGYVLKNKNIIQKIQIDEDLLFLFGLYIAEGHCLNGKVTWTLHEKEIELRKEIERICKQKFNINIKSTKGTSKAIQLHAYSKLIFEFFKNILGTGSINKKIGGFLFYNKVLLASLLRGYFLGDGCYGDTFYRCETISRTLAYEINFALLRYGIYSGISLSTSTSIKDPKRKKLYSIQISKNSLERFKSLMNPKYPCFLKKLPPTINLENSDFITDYKNNRIYSMIENKRLLDTPTKVFNLEVDRDESYVIEGSIPVHNCKNVEHFSIPAWIKQAQENQIEGTNWLLVVAKNRTKPIVILDIDAFFSIIQKLQRG